MTRPGIEIAFERALFAIRWLMAPVYLSFAAVLVMLIVVILRQIATYVPQALTMTPETAILAALTVIDLTLVANLLVIVMFSGYETFVSRFDLGENPDRPTWIGTVDFAGLKMKLIASIVAISAIDLLKRFMAIAYEDAASQGMADPSLFWPAAIHLVFVLSGLLMALMDWLVARSGR